MDHDQPPHCLSHGSGGSGGVSGGSGGGSSGGGGGTFIHISNTMLFFFSRLIEPSPNCSPQEVVEEAAAVVADQDPAAVVPNQDTEADPLPATVHSASTTLMGFDSENGASYILSFL